MTTKYDLIGKGYNRTRRPDPQLLSNLMDHLSPQAGAIYLDIGCGTGNYTIELFRNGVEVVGVDPSEKMLEKARTKESKIKWQQGTAENIPVADASFDGGLGTLTTHHWTNLEEGFKEINRVLKPGARLVIFTATPAQMDGYWLNYYFPKMLSDSKEQMPGLEATTNAMEQGGLKLEYTEPYFIQADLKDLFLYSGKHDPELYFDEQVRSGISSFSSLSNAEEVKSGLAKLRVDIDSGKVNEVIQQYQNEGGDYLYLVARK